VSPRKNRISSLKSRSLMMMMMKMNWTWFQPLLPSQYKSMTRNDGWKMYKIDSDSKIQMIIHKIEIVEESGIPLFSATTRFPVQLFYHCKPSDITKQVFWIPYYSV
jgi:hypothetical protein